jgi:hypothetical protein
MWGRKAVVIGLGLFLKHIGTIGRNKGIIELFYPLLTLSYCTYVLKKWS